MSEDRKHFGDTSLGQGIAVALVILAFCLGIGSCGRMVMTAQTKGAEAPEQPQAFLEGDQR